MSNDLIVKHNKIIEGKYNMTTTEIKIIAKLTSLINKDDDDFKEYVFISKNLLDELNLGKENYTALEESINKLISRRIEIEQENKKKKLVTTFLSSCMYDNTENESKVILRYDPQLKPYFLQLGEHFTKYYLENVLELNSFYAIRIYELCKQYERLRERVIQVEILKEILEIEEKYKKYNDFKKKVLEIAKREINEKTDITISFEEIKTGRKVTAIMFLISAKKEIKSIKNKTEIELIETKKEYSGAVTGLFELLPVQEQIEVRKSELEKLLQEHSIEMLRADIEYCNEQRPEKYWSYFVKSVNSGHYSSDELEKAKLKEQQKLKKKEQEEKLKKEQEEREQKLKMLIEKKFKELTDEELQEYENRFKALPNAVKKTTAKDDLIREWIREEMKQATA